MTFDQALLKLTKWIEASKGEAIEIGDDIYCEFHQTQTYTETDLDILEKKLNWKLPSEYRAFMKAVGRSRLFVDPQYGIGIDFYSIEEILQTHQELRDLDEDEPITDLFCMIGASTAMGDFIGYTINRDAPDNFDVYCHEYPVFEYVSVSDEIKSWRTFPSWIIHVVETLGEETI